MRWLGSVSMICLGAGLQCGSGWVCLDCGQWNTWDGGWGKGPYRG